MTNWKVLPKDVLVWVIMDAQLPIAAAPTRQVKATLVEALERYERQLLQAGNAEKHQWLMGVLARCKEDHERHLAAHRKIQEQIKGRK